MSDSQRSSVMHVLAPAAFGGAESVVQGLVRGLAERGHHVAVVQLLDDSASGPFGPGLGESGVEVVSLRLPPRSYRREARELARLFGERRPDVIHTHGFRADLQAGRVARGLGIPRISTVHGFTGGGFRIRLYERLQVRALRSFEAVVAVSQPLAALLAERGVPRERLRMLRNAWCGGTRSLERAASRAELGLPSEAFVVGWVGRLSAEKGGDVFVEALGRLPELSLLACVIGDGPERPALERRAAELGFAQRIRWCGVRADASRLFRAFDAFVLSSRTEGTPMVLLEAMDAGVPVVASAVGGVPDVIGTRDAWLVTPDDPSALASALRELQRGPAEAARRAHAARQRLGAEFAAGAWLDGYERIYGEARGRGTSSRA